MLLRKEKANDALSRNSEKGNRFPGNSFLWHRDDLDVPLSLSNVGREATGFREGLGGCSLRTAEEVCGKDAK